MADTSGYGVGTQQATESGMNVASTVEEYYRRQATVRRGQE